jgi:hypothetical protein
MASRCAQCEIYAKHIEVLNEARCVDNVVFEQQAKTVYDQMERIIKLEATMKAPGPYTTITVEKFNQLLAVVRYGQAVSRCGNSMHGDGCYPKCLNRKRFEEALAALEVKP